MADAPLISRYEAVAHTSRAMAEAAGADEWSRVDELACECRALIAQLRAVAQIYPLSKAGQRRRIQLLGEILADDAQIRVCAEPWLEGVERLLAGRPGPSG